MTAVCTHTNNGQRVAIFQKVMWVSLTPMYGERAKQVLKEAYLGSDLSTNTVCSKSTQSFAIHQQVFQNIF